MLLNFEAELLVEQDRRVVGGHVEGDVLAHARLKFEINHNELTNIK